jgi:hypothetical protein
MTCAMDTIPRWGPIQSRQDGERPRPCRHRQLHKYRDDDPLMAPAVGRIAVGRPPPIAMPPLAEDLGARVLGDRLIASYQHWPWRDQMVPQKCEQSASQGPGRPPALSKHTMRA